MNPNGNDSPLSICEPYASCRDIQGAIADGSFTNANREALTRRYNKGFRLRPLPVFPCGYQTYPIYRHRALRFSSTVWAIGEVNTSLWGS